MQLHPLYKDFEFAVLLTAFTCFTVGLDVVLLTGRIPAADGTVRTVDAGVSAVLPNHKCMATVLSDPAADKRPSSVFDNRAGCWIQSDCRRQSSGSV